MQGELPDHLRGWNWGAFLLNWVWGLANGTYIALLMFVPVVNLVMPFVLGAKGNAWAWRNGEWRDEDHFERVQRIWAWAGVAAWVGIGGFVALLFWGIVSLMEGSGAYQDSLARVQGSPRVQQMLGKPILRSGWMVSGNIEIKGSSGNADLSYGVAGPKGEGTVYVNAYMKRDRWVFTYLSVDTDAREIVLVSRE